MAKYMKLITKRLLTLLILFSGLFFLFSTNSLSALTKEEMQEIRQIVREELRIVEAWIDGLEKRVDGLENGLEKRIDSLEKRIDDLRAITLTGFAILFLGMFSLIGFVIWDRRTAITPVTKKTKDLEEREEVLEKIIKEYATVEPKLLEILKSFKIKV